MNEYEIKKLAYQKRFVDVNNYKQLKRYNETMIKAVESANQEKMENRKYKNQKAIDNQVNKAFSNPNQFSRKYFS